MKVTEYQQKNSSITKSVFTRNRKIVIATKHRKEQVIAPLLEDAFQFQCSLEEMDTDQLGTFTGEVARTLSAFEAARKKCELAMDASGADMAISSEGSFGAHPYIPFCQANEELVLLCDRRNNIEIFGKALTTETNFSGSFISSYKEAASFARRVGFPRHALILRESENSEIIFAKGLSDVSGLKSMIQELLCQHPKIWMETDMRAMYNPTRMKIIGTATSNLIEKMCSCCPSCDFPGYWIEQVTPGLPCFWCGTPTNSILSHEYACLRCSHRSTIRYPHGKLAEDPMYCDHCNP